VREVVRGEEGDHVLFAAFASEDLRNPEVTWDDGPSMDMIPFFNSFRT
jgi:hypothetical protein